jgi:hypothetical protein
LRYYAGCRKALIAKAAARLIKSATWCGPERAVVTLKSFDGGEVFAHGRRMTRTDLIEAE